MQTLLGCRVSPEHLDAWSQRLVFPQEPLFLTDETLSLLPQGTVRYTRQEYRDISLTLDYVDAYRLYAISKEPTWVAFLSPQELRSVPREAQLKLSALQAAAGRGQIYDWEWIERVLTGDAILRQFEPYIFTADDTPKLMLSQDLWDGLSGEQRQQWLTALLTDNTPPVAALLSCKSQTGSGSKPSTVRPFAPWRAHLPCKADPTASPPPWAPSPARCRRLSARRISG